ncbi:hypothetical protein CXG81DRAFT_28798 [Caulochytrium protostelioides]|uniref:ARM repeat-containing protein n=1 Tax=Caulochytrium protostelioides TaxID=1555241 RepID=A0A4P9WY04_9FUNG|nr:hypothetical protein CXG81DRAFT_28798 [Caulochytrium protostelioides]|eukprot:RKO98361.1 hypothetical protein CXG81DRAFT_28798 [Caulochytrium protostelioides]
MPSGIDWGEALPSDVDDEKSLDEAKLSKRLLKSDEEINRYVVPEGLSEIDRALYINRNGVPIQRLGLLNSLPRLLADSPIECRSRVLTPMLDEMAIESAEFQIACATVMTETILPTQTTLLGHALIQRLMFAAKPLRVSKQSEVAQAWSAVFLALLAVVSVDVLESQIVPETLAEGGLSQPVHKRVWVCTVLGAVGPRLQAASLKQQLCDKAIQLCQDTDQEVRSAMAAQLRAVATCFLPAAFKETLVPALVELVEDEQDRVATVALGELTLLAEQQPSDWLNTVLIALWVRCTTLPPHGVMTLALARELGRFLWCTHTTLKAPELAHFLDFYHTLATSDLAERRVWAAHNLPAVIAVARVQAAERRFDGVISALLVDMDATVRRKIAACLHEISNMLAPTHAPMLLTALQTLSTDVDASVAEASMSQVTTVLKNLKRCDGFRDGGRGASDMLHTVLRYERVAFKTMMEGRSWRTHAHLIEHIANFGQIFTTTQISDEIVPLMTTLIESNVVMVTKDALIRALVTYLRQVKTLDARERIVAVLVGLKNHRNYQCRLLFMRGLSQILATFSAKFFRLYFLNEYMAMIRDPVPSIRARYARLIPLVRRTLVLPADAAVLKKLLESMSHLLAKEPDRDVCDAVIEAGSSRPVGIDASQASGGGAGASGSAGGALDPAVESQLQREEDALIEADEAPNGAAGPPSRRPLGHASLGTSSSTPGAFGVGAVGGSNGPAATGTSLRAGGVATSRTMGASLAGSSSTGTTAGGTTVKRPIVKPASLVASGSTAAAAAPVHASVTKATGTHSATKTSTASLFTSSRATSMSGSKGTLLSTTSLGSVAPDSHGSLTSTPAASGSLGRAGAVGGASGMGGVSASVVRKKASAGVGVSESSTTAISNGPSSVRSKPLTSTNARATSHRA